MRRWLGSQVQGSFFGYGSLVNIRTHSYRSVQAATLGGWQRVWLQSSQRNNAFLSVTQNPSSAISGLIATVADTGWDELDAREAAYDRLEITDPLFESVQIYKASASATGETNLCGPILLSYLDCVVQGFNDFFGEDGVCDFFRSTTGWDTPILNDRNAPIYPRACSLSPEETDIVDKYLSMVGARVVHPD